MNTADRSIALMDAALRRRFYFEPFFLDEPPIKGLLRRWIAKNKPEAGWVADLVDLANRRLERDMGIGPKLFHGLRQDLGRGEGASHLEAGGHPLRRGAALRRYRKAAKV